MTGLSKAYSVGCAEQLRLLTRSVRADENIFTDKTTQRSIKQQADWENIPVKQYQALLVDVAFSVAEPLEDHSCQKS